MTAVRNIVVGALSGLGVVVLLQQFAVLYPTGTITVMGVGIGVAVQLALAGVATLGRTVTEPALVVPAGPPPQPAAAASPVPVWSPTHRVVGGGMDAWPVPDASSGPPVHVDAGVEVRVEALEAGWAHVASENGWSGWVDERRLGPLP